MICDYNIYDYLMIGIISLSYFVAYITIIYNIILYFLSKSKIKKKEK